MLSTHHIHVSQTRVVPSFIPFFFLSLPMAARWHSIPCMGRGDGRVMESRDLDGGIWPRLHSIHSRLCSGWHILQHYRLSDTPLHPERLCQSTVDGRWFLSGWVETISKRLSLENAGGSCFVIPPFVSSQMVLKDELSLARIYFHGNRKGKAGLFTCMIWVIFLHLNLVYK